jgi:hypothetical protein
MPGPGLFDLYSQSLDQGVPEELAESGPGELPAHDEAAEPDEAQQKEIAREALLQAAKARAAASADWQTALAEKNEKTLGSNGGNGSY